MPETVDRLSQAASRETFGESAPDERGCESSLLYAVRWYYRDQRFQERKAQQLSRGLGGELITEEIKIVTPP